LEIESWLLMEIALIMVQVRIRNTRISKITVIYLYEHI